VPLEGAKFGAEVVLLVREFVARALGTFGEQLKAFGTRIDALEQRAPIVMQGERGEKGERGEEGAQGVAGPPGEPGAAGRDGTDGKDGESGAQGERGAEGAPGRDGDPGAAGPVGPQGEKGLDGKDGTSITLEDVRPMLAALVSDAVAAIPKPQDGERGERGEKGESGQDGRTLTAEEIRPVVAEFVAKAVAEIPVPKDGQRGEIGPSGRDGRDAIQLEIMPAVDPERRYARNTVARHAGGLIRAFRDTDVINLAEMEKSGWECILEGIAGETEEVLDGGRLIKRTTTYTSGRKLEREFKTSAWVDRGIWKEGTYEQGDVVAWGGSSFVAQRETMEKPDSINTSGDWRLVAKRGRDGKDLGGTR